MGHGQVIFSPPQFCGLKSLASFFHFYNFLFKFTLWKPKRKNQIFCHHSVKICPQKKTLVTAQAFNYQLTPKFNANAKCIRFTTVVMGSFPILKNSKPKFGSHIYWAIWGRASCNTLKCSFTINLLYTCKKKIVLLETLGLLGSFCIYFPFAVSILRVSTWNLSCTLLEHKSNMIKKHGTQSRVVGQEEVQRGRWWWIKWERGMLEFESNK
jgi:hypothetical protein